MNDTTFKIVVYRFNRFFNRMTSNISRDGIFFVGISLGELHNGISY